MTALIISETPIRQDAAGRFCLNDLHKAAGGASKHRPSEWLRINQAKELVQEIQKAGIPAIQSKQQLGTFAVKELIYAYAMWINSAFHLRVIRAFDALVTGRPALAAPIVPPQPETVTVPKADYAGLQTQLAQQNELLALYRFKAETLEKQAKPKPKRQNKGPITKSEIYRAQELHEQGSSIGAIAKTLGRSSAAISYLLRGAQGGAA
jgi:hypothetical protein